MPTAAAAAAEAAAEAGAEPRSGGVTLFTRQLRERNGPCIAAGLPLDQRRGRRWDEPWANTRGHLVERTGTWIALLEAGGGGGALRVESGTTWLDRSLASQRSSLAALGRRELGLAIGEKLSAMRRICRLVLACAAFMPATAQSKKIDVAVPPASLAIGPSANEANAVVGADTAHLLRLLRELHDVTQQGRVEARVAGAVASASGTASRWLSAPTGQVMATLRNGAGPTLIGHAGARQSADTAATER